MTCVRLALDDRAIGLHHEAVREDTLRKGDHNSRGSIRRRRLAGVSGGERAMTNISFLGVDLGKNVCSEP
jgi:hypothetical protein